jgi:hypothetical protein
MAVVVAGKEMQQKYAGGSQREFRLSGTEIFPLVR